MTVRYERIYTDIWRYLKDFECNEDEALLFLNILTSPHSTLLGLFYCPRNYLLEDLPGNWTPEKFETAFQRLIHRHMIKYDEQKRMILVPLHLDHNPFASANHIVAAIKLVYRIGPTPLLNDYLILLKNLPQKDLGKLIGAVTDTLRNGVGTPSRRRRNAVGTPFKRR